MIKKMHCPFKQKEVFLKKEEIQEIGHAEPIAINYKCLNRDKDCNKAKCDYKF